VNTKEAVRALGDKPQKYTKDLHGKPTVALYWKRARNRRKAARAQLDLKK